MKKVKKNKSDKILQAAAYTFMLCFAALCLYPLLLTLMVSVSDELSVQINGYRLLPAKFSLDTYGYIFQSGAAKILGAYGVSILVTLLGTGCSITVTAMLSYALASQSLKYKSGISLYCFITMIVNAGTVPFYILCTKYLHLDNKLYAMFLPYLLNAWWMFVLRNYFRSIPTSLLESARIDGASDFTVFVKIALPLAKVGVITIAMFYALQYWNDWWLPLLFIQDEKLLPLNDLIDRYGQNIKKMIPEKHFEATTISGNIYAIPSSYGPAAEKFNSILVRQDILEAVDMEKIASLAELESYAAMATEKFPEMKVATFFPYDLPAELMRELLDDSYTSLSDVFYVNESAAEAAVYDIDEIGLLKKVNEITSAWRERGWIPEEAFVKSADGIGRMDSGTYLMTEGAVSRPMENVLNLRKNVPEGKYAEYLLSPDKAKYIKIPGNEALMISSYSTAGEGVIKWLNWIYESQENYNATVLGTEGIDYQLVDGKYEALHNDAMLYEWIFRNINYMVYPTYADDTFINAFQNWDNDAQYSKAFGFAFNGEALKAELAKVDSVNQEILYPIILGYADYDENIQKLRDAWNAAGLDQIKAAYNEQLKAYSGN